MSLKLVSESVILVVLLSISSSSGFVVAKCGECPEIPAPICGSDGITWPSKCILECEMRIQNKNTKVVHEGVCSTKNESKNTEQISAYPTKTEQTDANTKTPNSRLSVTTEQDNTPKSETVPVKTSNTDQASTKQSSDSKDNYKKKTGYSLTTVARITEDCACTEILKPVCGTDGVTYNSVCLLRCARQKNANLEVFRQGSCDQKKRDRRSVYDLRYSIHRASPCSF